MIQRNQLLLFEDSGCQKTAVNQVTLPAKTRLPLTGYPEERLYYFLDGRGIFSIYEQAPQGDVYEMRQDTAVYLTPAIQHEIINVGDTPLRYIEFLVSGGLAPEGGLSWSAITQRGVTIDKPAVGSGVAVTKVFDGGSNPAKVEGLHLEVRDIWLRRPQKLVNAEVLTIAPGRATRLHTHFDTSETSYVLYGEGHFVWDEKQIPCQAGSVISYPFGVQRQVVNTGQFPLSYVLIAATGD
jgi:mannose-6-phosphate isomerase-like protein (cupin superfamily)